MNPENIPAEDLEYLTALAGRMRDPSSGLEVKTRKWYLKKYPACFIASEAIDWLLRNEPGVRSRGEAVEVGLELQAAGLLHHVTRDHMFQDAMLFFRFSADEESKGESSKWNELLQPLGALFGEENANARGLISQRSRESGLNSLRDTVLNVIVSLQVSPLDEHNIKLLDNVHPAKWVPPTPETRYNLVVIGAGTAGLVTSSAAAGLGAKVALIERHLMGGDCLNVGCVPSKALLACAKRVHQVRTAGEFGVIVEGPVRVDFAAIMERMRRIRAEISWNDGAPRYASQLGVDVFFGKPRFVAPDEVKLEDGTSLKFSRAVICTGARAAIPKIEGLLETPFLTNETIFNLTELPLSLIIIGGGVVGCELGQAFARFGTKVELLIRGEELLKREDTEAQAILEKQLEADGVKIYRKMVLKKVEHINGSFVVTTPFRVFTASALLCATGRAPNVEDLGLDVAGVQFDLDKGIQVNDFLQTTRSTIYAAGDCCSALKFTHVADFQARIVLRNALFFGHAKASALTVPWCTYTDPEIAHVGLYESDSEVPLEVFRMEFSENDRSICEGETTGFVKILVEKSTDRIVGATVVGAHAGDIISELTMAIVKEVGLSSIASVIHSYPTKQDAVRRCGDFYNRTKLSPAVKVVFRKFMTARRNVL